MIVMCAKSGGVFCSRYVLNYAALHNKNTVFCVVLYS